MKIYVINLDHDTKRRESMQKQLNQLNLQYEFSTGILGSELTPQQKEEWYDEKRAFRHLCMPITPAHIGCSLSHVNVYRKIIDQNLPCALIFEDDVILPHKLNKIISEIEKAIDKERPEVILLSPATGYNRNFRKVSSEISILPYKNGFFTSSYIVTNLAARALLKELFPVSDVADCWKRLVRHKVIDLFVLNSGFIEQDQSSFGSSTNADFFKFSRKGIRHKIKFKFCRAFWLFFDHVLAFFHRNFRPYFGVLNQKK